MAWHEVIFKGWVLISSSLSGEEQNISGALQHSPKQLKWMGTVFKMQKINKTAKNKTKKQRNIAPRNSSTEIQVYGSPDIPN